MELEEWEGEEGIEWSSSGVWRIGAMRDYSCKYRIVLAGLVSGLNDQIRQRQGRSPDRMAPHIP